MFLTLKQLLELFMYVPIYVLWLCAFLIDISVLNVCVYLKVYKR